MQRNIKFTLSASALALSHAIQVTAEQIDYFVQTYSECEEQTNSAIRAYHDMCDEMEGLDKTGVEECMDICLANEAGCAMECEQQMNHKK